MVDYSFSTQSDINVDRRSDNFDSGWLLSEMHRATGSVNFPQLLKRLETKTGQVRNLLFRREAIGNKEFRNTKSDNTTAISGPGVSFGYEDGTNTTTNTTGTAPTGGLAGSIGVNKTYHNEYPEMNLFPIKALQTPITSYGGIQGRGGYIEQGSCKFYIPSRGYIRNYVSFLSEFRFRQIEPQDKLIDVDRVTWSFPSSNQTGISESDVAYYNLEETHLPLEQPHPTMYPTFWPPRGMNTTDRPLLYGHAANQANKGIAGLGAGGGSIYWAGPDVRNTLVGADCKRLRMVFKANYGHRFTYNYDPVGSSPAPTVGKTYTYDNTYSSYSSFPASGTETLDTWMSTIGLAFIYMKVEIPDDAHEDNYRTVYGHWTFTAPDDTYDEQTFRSSTAMGGTNWSYMDWMMIPVNEMVVIDLPFYGVEEGDTRTLRILGRDYIATFGTSTIAPTSSHSPSRWSDGTQTPVFTNQVGGSWDLDRLVYTENIGGSSTDRGSMVNVGTGFVRNSGVHTNPDGRFASYFSDGGQPDGKEGVPLQKVAGAVNTRVTAATSTLTFYAGDVAEIGDTLTLISEDSENTQTTKTYTWVAQGDEDAATGKVHASNTATTQVDSLQNAIEHAQNHGGKITCSQSASGLVLTLTQAVAGEDGNTTVTVTGATTGQINPTNFTGGTSTGADIGATTVEIDSGAANIRVGAPVFTSLGVYVGTISQIASETVLYFTEGIKVALANNAQTLTYPWYGHDHWVEDFMNNKPELEVHELFLYEDAEWVVNSIKDYKDEYQELKCTKVRGKRHSRRLAHG